MEQQRDAYASKILPLGIKIAVIFLIPAAIAVLLNKFLNVPIRYTLPVAFLLSWYGVIMIYRKTSREVRALDQKIKELRNQDVRMKTEEDVSSSGTDAN